MNKRTKNIFKALTVFMALTMTVCLVSTLSVAQKGKTFLCETDRILDGFTVETAENAYPNGTDSDHPSYSVGLEYSVDTSTGAGTLESPYKAAVGRGTCTATDIALPEYYQVGTTYYKLVAIDQDGFNAKKPAKNASGSEIGCYDLTSITSLKDFSLVGSQAFAYTSISEIEFSHNLSELSPSTFFHCKNLEKTDFVRLEGEAQTEAGTYAAFKKVGDNCFADCVKYEGMTLPRTLRSIGNGAYQNCISLTSIFLPITDVIGQFLEVGSYAFAGCTKVTVIYLSSRVNKIGEHAFEGCINAKGYSALSYSELIEQLGETGDGDWNYLFNSGNYDNAGTNDTFLDFTGRNGGGDVDYDRPYFYTLNDDHATCTLISYDGSFSDEPDKPWMNKVNRVIPETRGAGYPVTVIGQELFKDNKDMKTLSIPSSVKTIGLAAFAGCTNLESIALVDGLERIEKYAFAPWNGGSGETQSNKLTTLSIPKTVQWIGDYAFPYMYDVMNIEFRGSKEDQSDLYHIGKYAFYKAGDSYKNECYTGGSFEEVRNPLILNMHPPVPNAFVQEGGTNNRPKSGDNTYTEIGDYAFFGNQWMGAIRLQSDTLLIDGYAFANCRWLVEADLGSDLKTMGGCKNSSAQGFALGYAFAMNVGEKSVNDLGGPLENNASADTKPYVPMSSLYIEKELKSGKYVGTGTLDGRYQTMVYTGASRTSNNKWFFRWELASNSSDIQLPYTDRGVIATSDGSEHNMNGQSENGFSNDEATRDGYSGYYGVDLASGASYLENTYSSYPYKIRQGGYYDVKFAHATVTPVTNGEEITYTTTYKDGSGNEITSLDANTRYGFTVYDSETGRAKFDFVQKKGTTHELIMSKFHYNPYWEQSCNVVVPETVVFGGRTFNVTEIGNCAFFRNICPESHAWVGNGDASARTYVSPQSDTTTTNPNKDSNNNYYATTNDIFYNLESVVLPPTIKRIGGNAFYMCAGLQSIKTTGNNTEGRFPRDIEKIQQYAFAFTGITAVSLPKGISHFGNQHGLCHPFTGCMALTSISVDADGSVFGSNGNYLTDSAGNKVVLAPLGTSSTTLTVPDGITTLGPLSFRGARQISKVEIPTSLTDIDEFCFDELRYGETVLADNTDKNNAPDKVIKGIFKRKVSNLSEMCVVKDEHGNEQASQLRNIGDSAFYRCINFQGIRFENELVNIGARAFYDCSKAANLYYLPDSLETIGKEAFHSNQKFHQIKTTAKPEGETDKYLNLAATSLREIGSNAFNVGSGIASFNTVSFPPSLTELNGGAIFCENYAALTTVYIHDSVVEMNSGLFKKNINLTTFKTWTGTTVNGQIPDNQKSTINRLPTNLKKIGDGCFMYCSKMTPFSTFPATLTKIGANAFESYTHPSFTSLDLGHSTASLEIRGNAFLNCTTLASLNFLTAPGSLNKAASSLKIFENAFKGCTGLNGDIILPKKTTAEANAFTGSNIQRLFVCDTYSAASGKISYDVANGTDAAYSVYYYADGTSDATGPGGTLYWHYEGTTPTPYTPS